MLIGRPPLLILHHERTTLRKGSGGNLRGQMPRPDAFSTLTLPTNTTYLCLNAWSNRFYRLRLTEINPRSCFKKHGLTDFAKPHKAFIQSISNEAKMLEGPNCLEPSRKRQTQMPSRGSRSPDVLASSSKLLATVSGTSVATTAPHYDAGNYVPHVQH